MIELMSYEVPSVDAARSAVMEVIVIGIVATLAADLWQRLVR